MSHDKRKQTSCLIKIAQKMHNTFNNIDFVNITIEKDSFKTLECTQRNSQCFVVFHAIEQPLNVTLLNNCFSHRQGQQMSQCALKSGKQIFSLSEYGPLQLLYIYSLILYFYIIQYFTTTLLLKVYRKEVLC